MNWPPHERQKESDVQRIGLQHPTRFRLPDGMKNQGLQYYIHDESDALRSGQSPADPNGGIQNRRDGNQAAKLQTREPMQSRRGHAAAFFADGFSTELARRHVGLQVGRKTRGQPRERTLRRRARRMTVAFDYQPW